MSEQATDKYCIIAVSPNSWGRGQTVAEAEKNLVKAGGTKRGRELRMVVGTDQAYIDEMGYAMLPRDVDVKYFKI